MKYLLILLVLVGFTGPAFAEDTFSGHSSIDPLVSEIIPRKPTMVNVLFQYTTGPYALDELTPNVQITPDSASKFVKIDVEPIEINQGEIRRIPITITVNQNIEHEKIFLSISFSGKHFQTNSLYKSSWNESVTLDIATDDIGFALGDCKPIDIDYEISDGKAPIICKSQNENSVKAFVDVKNDGIITLDIPKHILYGIGSTDCRLDNDFLVIYDGEEIVADITGKNDSNIVSVGFDSGIHEIEIVGTFIMPDPSPAQYCGIVENYSKLYLSPLDQIQHDMKPVQIRCNDDLVLVYKNDDSPACVNRDIIPKLIQREWIDVDPRLEADKKIPKFLCELYGGEFFDGTGECMDIGKRKCEMLGGVWDKKCIVPELVGMGIDTEPDPNPTPEPELIPEAEELKRQIRLTALNEVQEILQTDYRGNEIKINAIQKYVDKFESDYFMKQFLFALKDQYKKDDMINFIFTEWGYQNQECTSPKLTMYLKPYANYTAFGSIEKIYEWQNPNYCDSLEPYSAGYLILNFWRMPDFPEQYRVCTVPGEYKIFASSLSGESPEPVDSFTCQREMLKDEPQPWMELPD